MNFSTQLKQFLDSKQEFAVLHSTLPHDQLITSSTDRLVVLDSSFNPPHLGHYALAREALNFDYNGNSDTLVNEEQANSGIESDTPSPKLSTTLLLLLSVKNADKISPIAAPFEHRLAMMYLMARHWYALTNVNVSIAVTCHAKFVDKLVAILKELDHPVKLTFAVGYDTLVRILDEKYYLPDKLLDSLCEFMASSDIFCLTRAEKDKLNQDQLQFVKDVGHGKFAHIPPSWSKSIHIFNVADSSVALISSSQVRSNYKEKQHVSDSMIFLDINNYILKNALYAP